MIRYYAHTDDMGDITTHEAEGYRAWAKQAIENEYPGHDVEVINAPALEFVATDDENRRDEIVDFCARLWDSCPWLW